MSEADTDPEPPDLLEEEKLSLSTMNFTTEIRMRFPTDLSR